MEVYDKLKEKTQKAIIRKVISGLDDTSNENILQLIKVASPLVYTNATYKSMLKGLKKLIEENHPFIGLIKRVLKDTHPNCREKLVENLILGGLVSSYKKRRKLRDQGKCSPDTVLISPTMRCNLDCIGCYAKDYDKKDDLSFEVIDRVLTEAEEMGTSFFSILGGEPFVVKDKLFELVKKHNKAYFQIYTNGSLVNEDLVKNLIEVGNILPIISIEGTEEETDARRGKGVYQKVIAAMDLLKKNKVPFGVSVTVTRKNAETVSSDKFLDDLIERGASIGWYFLFMPIGEKPNLDLMPTPEQRKMLFDRWKKVRATKPIFVVDFWNDAPYVGGCIAGKHYVHITSKGDVEPCIFTHFAVDNIKDKSLSEVFESDFFKEIRSEQPYGKNLFRPCMWIDHPKKGKELCTKFGCYPTHKGADAIIKDEKTKEHLKKYAKRVKEIYAPVWEDFKDKEEKKC